MEPASHDARLRELKEKAHGRWTELLKALGVDEAVLNRKNQPCPINGCGGTDRFQYTDAFGEGNYHCRACGAGGGLKLAQGALGYRFGELVTKLEALVGTVRPAVVAGPPSAERMKALARKIWDEAKPVRRGDPVDQYLRNRGLVLLQYPRALRYHPALGYYEKDATTGKSKKVTVYGAMLACIQAADGHAITLHRTYLKDGGKALGKDSKKVLSAGINGAAVRLCEPTDELAVTEGIETGLAVHLSTGKPVWSALSAGNLEKLWLPESARKVCIYADNDADSEFDGQAAAFALARRLMKEAKSTPRREVEVHIPQRSGADWADVWLTKQARSQQAA